MPREKITLSEADPYGRILSITEGDSTAVSTSYEYDPLDRLARTQVFAQQCHDFITITYDSLGRKVSMSDPNMGDWRYTYDVRGNLKCQVDVGSLEGGDTSTMTCYNYDPINRVTRKYFMLEEADGDTLEIDSNLIVGDTTHLACIYYPTVAMITKSAGPGSITCTTITTARFVPWRKAAPLKIRRRPSGN